MFCRAGPVEAAAAAGAPGHGLRGRDRVRAAAPHLGVDGRDLPARPRVQGMPGGQVLRRRLLPLPPGRQNAGQAAQQHHLHGAAQQDPRYPHTCSRYLTF